MLLAMHLIALELFFAGDVAKVGKNCFNTGQGPR
jgi:hypothetical protein